MVDAPVVVEVLAAGGAAGGSGSVEEGGAGESPSQGREVMEGGLLAGWRNVTDDGKVRGEYWREEEEDEEEDDDDEEEEQQQGAGAGARAGVGVKLLFLS